jgi:tetratricopeptide (TPR) repeat protein
VVFFLFVLIAVGVFFLMTPAGTSKQSSPDETDSENVPLEELSSAQEIVSRAKKLESNNEWEAAREAWNHLIEVDPDRPEAYFRRGIAAYRCDDYEQAVGDFEKIIEEQDDPPPEIHLQTAKTYLKLNQPQEGYSHYRTYHEMGEPGPSRTKEIADLARSLERWSEAREYYEALRENSVEENYAIRARLNLAEMALNRDIMDRVESEMEALDELDESDKLDGGQQLHYWYLKAKLHDINGKKEKSDKLYRQIYQRDPSFRDVEDIVEKQIEALDADSLIEKFQRMDKTTFDEFCQRVVEGMEHKVVQSKFEDPEELDILARKQSMSPNVNRVLFSFKRWQETAGELAIKEFEFKLLENRYDKGYFINPAGYNSAAENHARGNQKIKLVSVDEILTYFKQWYKES